MKFRITMKDPDGVYDCLMDAARKGLESIPDLPEEAREVAQEKRLERFRQVTQKWFKYGEYLTVEIDTEAETISVVPTE